MSGNQKAIKINHPCPMTLGRIKANKDLSCKSCNQKLIDFRNKSNDEIIEVITGKKICGIFNNDQVGVPKFSFRHDLLFKLLTALAILGFHVKPLQAQENKTRQDSVSVKKENINSEEKTRSKDTTQFKPRKEKWWRKKKRPNYRVIGTPSF